MRNVPNEPLGGEFVGRMVQTQRKKQKLFLLLLHIKQLIMKLRKNLIHGFGDLFERQESLVNQIICVS
jgi:hypothetical protein